MKNIIILITTILFSINIVNAEEKKTLAKTLDWDGKCVAEHKISPGAISCAIKNSFRKLYTKKDVGEVFDNVSFTKTDNSIYNLYENNGVVKREKVINILNKLGQEERKILRNTGVKFGRYHIFLFHR